MNQKTNNKTSSEADASSDILCNSKNNDSIENSISNLNITKSTKERKRLYKNKNIIAEKALYEQAFDDYTRPNRLSKRNWERYKPHHFIIFHQTRRLKHLWRILDDSNGLQIDPYFEPKLNRILEEISKNQIERYYLLDEPYRITFQCPKDHGNKGKECKQILPLSLLENSLKKTIEEVNDQDIKSQLSIYLERIDSKKMEKFLETDERLRKQRKYAHYTRCPEVGCVNSNGFRCNLFERLENKVTCSIKKIITCPENGCEKKWCTLCEEKHEEDENCIIPDPRKKMSKEELKFHDEEVKAGREQWCPECFACYSKDENCDKVSCPRCNTKFCFGCGERLYSANYFEEHLTMGPVSEMYPDGHLGCRKTLIRWAAQDRAGHREWLRGSIHSRPLMRDVQFVTDDKLRPLEEEEKEFLNEIVVNADSLGIL